jgi:hypothetical protein
MILSAEPRQMKFKVKAGEALYSSPIPYHLGDCIFVNRGEYSLYNDRNLYNSSFSSMAFQPITGLGLLL